MDIQSTAICATICSQAHILAYTMKLKRAVEAVGPSVSRPFFHEYGNAACYFQKFMGWRNATDRKVFRHGVAGVKSSRTVGAHRVEAFPASALARLNSWRKARTNCRCSNEAAGSEQSVFDTIPG
jgi:hypothetical protein